MALILSGDTGVPASGMPAGSVIQTIIATTTTGVTSSNTTPVSTGLSVSITPTSTSSKISITFNGRMYMQTNGIDTTMYVYKNGSNLQQFRVVYAGSSSIAGQQTFTYIDTPATTSSVTYSIYMNSATSAGTLYLLPNNATDGPATLVVQEIKQ